MEADSLVSIITPSYNKGAFIEETILSVKNQTYPHIEHIVIDGGSTDGTLDILRKYGDILTWISEPDKGQSDAINKGWRMAKGEILAYLNADDTYMPWAVETAVSFLSERPEVDMVYGQCNLIDENGRVTGQYTREEFDLTRLMCCWCFIPQQTVFFRQEVLEEVGYLDTNLHMAMDLDMWIRIGLKFRIKYVPRLLANFRICPGTKSVDESYKNEADHFYILDKLFSNPQLPLEIRAFRSKAYAGAHLISGFHDYSARHMRSARRHFMAALRFRPQLILTNRRLFGYLISSCLGARATDVIVNWKRRLGTNSANRGETAP